MRIVAGEWGSRKLETLSGSLTRPTLDKVREAVFSTLGGFFSGGVVFDLYAGSGAVGLEALSRGMEHAYFADRNPAACRIIRNNIASLHAEEKCTVYHVSARKAIELLAEKEIRADIVYLDPPYAEQENEAILSLLSEKHLLNPGAVIAVESLKEESFAASIGSLQRVLEKIYGISKVTYYKEAAGEHI